MNDQLKNLEARCREALKAASSLVKDIAKIEARFGAVLSQVRALDAEAEKLEAAGYEAEARAKREEAEKIRLEETRWPENWKVIERQVRVHQEEVKIKLQEYEQTSPANIAELERRDVALRFLIALQQCFWNFNSRVSLANHVDLDVLPWVAEFESEKKQCPTSLQLLDMYESGEKPTALGLKYAPSSRADKESKRNWANQEIAKGRRIREKSKRSA